MMRYRLHAPNNSGDLWIVDDHRDVDDEHPMAILVDDSPECRENGNRIVDALNVQHEMHAKLIAPRQWWRKCGITRAIVKVSDKHVHYETVPTRAVTRMPRERFLDWVRKAEQVR